jgi:hypothetical protein
LTTLLLAPFLLLLLLPQTAAVSTLDARHFIAIAKRQMAALGVPDPTEECDSRYGSTYLARWAATGREICAPPPPTPPPTTGDAEGAGDANADANPFSSATTSSVYCAAHPGAELTACVARNLVLSDSDAFMGTPRVAPGTVPPELPLGAPGSVRLACGLSPTAATGGNGNNTTTTATDKVEALLRRRLDQDGPKQWIRAAFLAGGAGGGSNGGGGGNARQRRQQEVAAACAGRGLGGAAVERPVLLLTRTDGLNAFHTTENLLSVFSALAVAAPEMRRAGILPPAARDEEAESGNAASSSPVPSWLQAEVVLADQAWPGPFLDIWRRIAAGAGGNNNNKRRNNRRRAPPPPPRDGREAAAAPLVRHLASRPFLAGTCLRRAVLLPFTPHGQSLLTYTGVGSDGRCGASPVAFGAALWLRHALRAASPDGRGFLLAAAEALLEEEEGGGQLALAPAEPFAHGYVADGVAAPAWYVRYREEVAEGGGAAAALRFFGRKFGAGGESGGDETTAASSAASIVPPYSPHLVRLKLVWISRAHYERHGGGGGSKDEGRDDAGGADASAAAGGGSASSWQRQRRLSPDAEREVVLALQEAVLSWNARACALQAGEEQEQAKGDGDSNKPPRRHHRRRRLSDDSGASTTTNCRPLPVLFDLEALELSDLPFFPDQVHAFTRAGVVAGVHGAGLSNMLLMRPGCGAVVEVWHNMRDNYHYQNLAALLAHGYARVEGEGERVDAEALGARATEAMDRAAERHVMAARALLEKRRRRMQQRRRRRGDGGAFPWGFRG